MKKKAKIIYTKKGLANFYGDYIEINYNLKKNKRLRDYIVKHELGHSTKFDLWHEIKSINFSIMPSLLFFIIKHPSTWIDFLPVYFKEGVLIYDINLILLYIIMAVAILIKIFLI